MHKAFFALCLCTVFAPLTYSQESVYQQTLHPKSGEFYEYLPEVDAYINWTREVITVTGVQHLTSPIRNASAYLPSYSARLNTYMQARLAQATMELRINSERQIADYTYDPVYYAVQERIQSAQNWLPILQASTIHGAYELPIFGTNGLAPLFFDNNRAATPHFPQVESSANLPQIDSLIVDLSAFKQFHPSIFTRIVDENGQILYGIDTVSSQILTSRGPYHYVSRLANALQDTNTLGAHVYYVMPLQISGASHNTIVLSQEDARRIFGNPDTRNRLNQGKVILLRRPREAV